MSETAAMIFEESLNQLVLVTLRGERAVGGKLLSFDEHMNLVLEDAEEISNILDAHISNSDLVP